MSSKLPKIWKEPKHIEPQYYVRFYETVINICHEDGNKVPGGTIFDFKRDRRVSCVCPEAATHAGILLAPEREIWDKDQCIETLSRYIKENMQ